MRRSLYSRPERSVFCLAISFTPASTPAIQVNAMRGLHENSYQTYCWRRSHRCSLGGCSHAGSSGSCLFGSGNGSNVFLFHRRLSGLSVRKPFNGRDVVFVGVWASTRARWFDWILVIGFLGFFHPFTALS